MLVLSGFLLQFHKFSAQIWYMWYMKSFIIIIIAEYWVENDICGKTSTDFAHLYVEEDASSENN